MRILSMIRSTGLLALTAAILMISADALGQGFRKTMQIEDMIERLETNTDRFSNSIDAALDSSRFNNTDIEDQANALVDELEFATDRLKDRADDNIVNTYDVNQVLRRGMYLDMFMRRHNFRPTAERDWRMVRFDLDQLAHLYGVTWTWVPQTMRSSALNRAWTKQIIHRLEQTTDEFRNSFDAGLDRSRIDGSAYEDFLNNIIAQFERAVDKLEDDANDSKALNQTDIRLALTNAAAIDEFMRRYTLPLRARRDWARVKANLDDLAFLNQVTRR